MDVLCGYLRMPYEPDPGEDAPEERVPFMASREVRHTVIRVITAHLKEAATPSWQGLNFDFRGVVFDGGDFGRARFSGGEVNFNGALFAHGTVSFSFAKLGGPVYFRDTVFADGTVSFSLATFGGGYVDFGAAKFSGGEVDFRGADFSGHIDFRGAVFSSGTVSFSDVKFFDISQTDFSGAVFSGGRVDFTTERFKGGRVDFSQVSDWKRPPIIPWAGPGVMLPEKRDQSQAQG